MSSSTDLVTVTVGDTLPLPTPKDKRGFSTMEAAKLLGVSQGTIYNRIQDKRLKARKYTTGSSCLLFVTPESLRACHEACALGAKPAKPQEKPQAKPAPKSSTLKIVVQGPGISIEIPISQKSDVVRATALLNVLL